MNRTEIIEQIIADEWEMFHTVNGDQRTGCQNDRNNFDAFRKAQYNVWSDKMLEQYSKDLKNAFDEGRNIVREKYIHMMKSTDPKAYELLKSELPETSKEKAELTERIWEHAKEQTLRLRDEYPILAFGGRPLEAKDELGFPSVETYQKGELLTYSKELLELYLECILDFNRKGTDMFRRIQEESVFCKGYKSLAEAEEAMSDKLIDPILQFQKQTDSCCSGSDCE